MITPFSIYNNSNGSSDFKPAAANENRVIIEIHSPFYRDGQAHVFATIIGYLSKELQYESKGNYKDIYNVVDLQSVPVNIVSDELQRNIANYGMLTKKTYVNSESPVISFEFRCLANDTWTYIEEQDNTQINNPIKIANYLIGMTTPHVGANAVLLQDKIFNGGANNQPMADVNIQGDSIGTSIAKIANDFSSRKPPVCLLTIGKIFQKDMMVLKNVSVTISKEYYAPGVPLYADFSVTFESLFGAVSISNPDLTGKSAEEEIEALETLNRNEKVFGSGFNSYVSVRDTRIQFEGSDASAEDLSRLRGSLIPLPGDS